MSVFKNTQNKFLLGSMFKDIVPDSGYVRFSLDDDVEGLVNCRKTFVALEDATGYKWAMAYLGGSYEHWVRLMECRWFRDSYDSWMLELNAKIKARYEAEIRVLSTNDDVSDAVRLAALKYLHTDAKPRGRKAGAPSKEEIRGELNKAVRESREVAEDMERIGLKVV